MGRWLACSARMLSVSPLELRALSHLNAIVDGYEDTIDHLSRVFGAQMNIRIPGNPENPDDTDACLITIGDVIFELFAPRRRGERGQGRLLDRFGDHFIGVEFQVPDVARAREQCPALDVPIISDVGRYFLTHPRACVGISWEIWDGNWYKFLGPEGPGPLHPRAYWRDEHPLGLDGCARVSVAAENLDTAVERLIAVVGAREIGRSLRPQAVAMGAELQIGDTVFEVLAPTGSGPISSFIDRYGERIRSTVFKTIDLDRVAKHLGEQGIDLVPGDREGTLAIPPEQNHNLLFEFTE
jgi:hypothetical protein